MDQFVKRMSELFYNKQKYPLVVRKKKVLTMRKHRLRLSVKINRIRLAEEMVSYPLLNRNKKVQTLREHRLRLAEKRFRVGSPEEMIRYPLLDRKKKFLTVREHKLRLAEKINRIRLDEEMVRYPLLDRRDKVPTTLRRNQLQLDESRARDLFSVENDEDPREDVLWRHFDNTTVQQLLQLNQVEMKLRERVQAEDLVSRKLSFYSLHFLFFYFLCDVNT